MKELEVINIVDLYEIRGSILPLHHFGCVNCKHKFYCEAAFDTKINGCQGYVREVHYVGYYSNHGQNYRMLI